MKKRGKNIFLLLLLSFFLSIKPIFAQSSAILTVNDTVLRDVNKNILGEAITLDQLQTLHDPLWRQSYKSLVQAINPGLIRFPHFKYYWERSNNSNYWRWDISAKKAVTLDKRLYLRPGGPFDQRIYPGKLETGKNYRFSFDYEAKGIGIPNGWDFHGVYIDLYHFEGEIYWGNGNGKNFVGFNLPSGDSSGHKSFDFTYSPISGKTPMVLLVSPNFGSKAVGEAWYDNFKLECINCSVSPGNLIKDGDFSLLSIPPDRADFGFTHRYSSRDLDDFVGFIRGVGAEPLMQGASYFETMNLKYNNPSLDPNNAQAVENAVLNFPGLQEAINAELDILRYANVEKGYGIKYWEFGNEPEIWWTWIDGNFNYGASSQRVYDRYKLYGLLYAKFSGQAKKIDLSIKLGTAVFSREYWKESIDGFFEGLRLGRERYDNTAPTPDFFSPHPYQLAAWGANPKCPEDQTVCIDNLLTYQDISGSASCPGSNTSINNMNANLDYISFFEPYFNCLSNYLKTKGVANPLFINTEWEGSGSTGVPYGRFGDEVWVADRLGRSARAGIYGQNHWYLGIEAGIINTFGKIGSPFLTKALYGKFLDNSTKILESASSNEQQMSIYPFRKNSTSPLYLVMTNRKKENGTTSTTVSLPVSYKNASFEEYRITCDDNSPNPDPNRTCLYERNAARLNGTFANTQNVLNLVNNQFPITGTINSNASYTFDFPNHAVIFWKINNLPPDTVAPNPVSVTCKYDETVKAITFFWNWTGDNTGAGCVGPVGYCQRTNVSDKGYACNDANNPPFWWQIVNETKSLTEYASYDNNPGNQKNTPPNSSDIDKNTFAVTCAGREQNKIRIDVETRDALGNMVGGPSYSNVRSAKCACGGFSCPVCPVGTMAKNLGNANCDTKIDALDFGLWKNIFLKGAEATEEEKALVDFDCAAGQTAHTVDLADFKIWAGNY